MNKPDTHRLISLAQAGDKSAQQDLLMRYKERLRRMIKTFMDPRLARRVDPSDVFQEAMVHAAKRLPVYLRETPVAFYPWIRQIVRDRLVDVHRHHIHARRRSIDAEDQGELFFGDASAAQLANRLVAHQTSPSHQFSLNERREQIQESLKQLPKASRELLLMRFVEQVHVKDLADILSISEAAVKSRIRRSLDQLYRLVGPNTGEF